MKTIIKPKFPALLLVLAGIMLLVNSCTKAKTAPRLPEGWFAYSCKPAGYWYYSEPVGFSFYMGIDRKERHNGKGSATIQSVSEKVGNNFATLMQSCSAGNYLGKRIRMSGYLKTKDVKDWAGLWFRVDVDTIVKDSEDKDVKTNKVKVNWNYYAAENMSYDDHKNSIVSVSFDNMHDGKTDRAVRGTTDWTKYEIVLDVPENSSSIAFGALLSGKGQIWFDDLSFEVVGESVETTGIFKTEYAKIAGKPALAGLDPNNLGFELVKK